MASHWFHNCFYKMMTKAADAVDFDLAGEVKIALWRAGTITKTMDFVGDLPTGVNGEIVATNYAGGWAGAGRKTLATLAVTEDNTNMRAVFDASVDPSWTALGGATNDTIAYAIVHKPVTSDALSPLICQLTITPTVTTNGGDFTIQFADPATAGGICYVAV